MEEKLIFPIRRRDYHNREYPKSTFAHPARGKPILGHIQVHHRGTDLNVLDSEREFCCEGGRDMDKIKIQGMTCQHCVMSVTKTLGSIPGIKNLKVDLVHGEATFENTQNVPMPNIRKAVEEAGYKVEE
jgi:copper chaperone